MNNTTIPVEFEVYLQAKIAAGLAPDMNEMVFAYIPNLDSEATIDRNNGLPDESQWVYQQTIDQAGKIDDNALAYSVVVPNVTPSFTFNAIYIHDKNQENSCGVVIHKPDETKEDGMSITRTLVQEYSGAASITGITVDASTWQIDYSDRLLGIDDDHRLSCLNSYGRAAFIEGFEPSPYPNQNKYKVTAGIAYVGGLRVVLKQDLINSHNTKPTTIYVDASRDGSALSKHINAVTVFTSNSSEGDNLVDYVDANGKQHYVEKLAEINADGTITDLRNNLIGALERTDNAATNEDIDNESTEEKHIKLDQFWRALTALKNTISENFLGINAQAKDSQKLEGNGADHFARAEQVLTDVPENAVFTDTQRGISDSVTSSSTITSASSKAVKEAYDKAKAALKDDESSLAENGYMKLSNGLIIQWGKQSITGNVRTEISFPVAFPNAVFSVTTSDQSRSEKTTAVYLTDNSSFGALPDGGDATGSGVKFIAIGH